MPFQVGAPPEIACLLDEIRRENDVCKRDAVSTCLGADPELDEFMVSFSLTISPSVSLQFLISFSLTILSIVSLQFLISLSFSLTSTRKRTAICWWSINQISRGLLMKQRPSWARLKCSWAISATMHPQEAFLVTFSSVGFSNRRILFYYLLSFSHAYYRFLSCLNHWCEITINRYIGIARAERPFVIAIAWVSGST